MNIYKLIKPFGYHVYADSVGGAWISLIEAVVGNGEQAFDEGRRRLCLQNVRIRVDKPKISDKLIEKYGDKANIDCIIGLTFNKETMRDCDVCPSFSPGPKSYYARIKEGEMDTYVVERLAKIPESKKAVISFIKWDDYKAVLKNPYDDYLPCIVSIQFRLFEKKNKYSLSVLFNARSIDVYQKSNGNMIAITMLANKIAITLTERLNKKVELDILEGMITDAHIYQECFNDAKKLINSYKKSDKQ